MFKWKGLKKKIGAREAIAYDNQTWLCMIRGMAVAFGITCIVFIAYSLLLTYTNLSESTLPMVSLACTALSAAVAGYDWAVCKRRKGLVYGALAGLVYVLLLFLVTSMSESGFSFTTSKLMTLVVAIAGGAIGGILGVNGNRKK